ncbi:MAG: hypothetical protein J6I55_08790 [Ruminococcus sp.]|nr:hypothetical protein [Ruminococcus sp.]HAE51942.1 hypothetical protein [Ruminococcus sp.]
MDRRQMRDDIENDCTPYGKYSHSEETKRIDLPPVMPQEEKRDFKGISGILNKILSDGKDPDKLLIAAIILMLIREGADKKLIIALGYIML